MFESLINKASTDNSPQVGYGYEERRQNQWQWWHFVLSFLAFFVLISVFILYGLYAGLKNSTVNNNVSRLMYHFVCNGSLITSLLSELLQPSCSFFSVYCKCCFWYCERFCGVFVRNWQYSSWSWHFNLQEYCRHHSKMPFLSQYGCDLQ